MAHVAMEATGVYGRPVWAVLEGQFEQMLVVSNTSKRSPDAGRKLWTVSGSPTYFSTDC
ncbi:MAG: hypothetical protein ACPL7M_06605 [Bryobacteraceae bacterium]